MSLRRGAMVAREAWSAAFSQPVASTVTVLMIVGMVLTVMLSTGRTVGAERRVLDSIDSAGTRTIQVRADTGAGLTADVLDRIDRIEGIEWAAAFSSAIDVTNTAIPDGTRVPMRFAYGDRFDRLHIPADPPIVGLSAYASPRALAQLGLHEVAGSITTGQGLTYAVSGQLSTPAFLRSFEPVVFVPQTDDRPDAAVSNLIVIAARPHQVSPVADAVLSVLAVEDPSKVTMQTSESLAELRVLVQAQLQGFSRGLVLLTLAISGVLVAVILYGLVMMRRRDFGRRRALGASRNLIVTLLLVQTALLAVTGTALGLVASVVALAAGKDPLPGWDFVAALSVLTVATALASALVPAVVASRREPVRELRVA